MLPIRDVSISGFASLGSTPGLCLLWMLFSCSLATPELFLVDMKGPRELGSRWPFLWPGSRLGFPCVQYWRSAHLRSQDMLSTAQRQLNHTKQGPAASTPSAGKCEHCWPDSMSSSSAADSRDTSRTGLDCSRRSFTVSTCWLAGQVTA